MAIFSLNTSGFSFHQANQIRVTLRHGVCGQQPLVVGDAHRLEGRAVGLVLPNRPLWQAGDFRRRIGQGIALTGELELQIHGRAPQEIRRAASRGRLRDKAIVYLGGVEIVVFHLQERIDALKSCSKGSTLAESVDE